MKKYIYFFIITGLFLLFTGKNNLRSQITIALEDTAANPYWIRMMQDPEANFYDTQRAFERYWCGRTNHKGNGWKVFKRWEYINQFRVQPDGKLPEPGSVAREYEKYTSSHSPKSINGNWTQIGPVASPGNATDQPNGLGRINAVGFHPTDPNIIFIGSPSGGLWKSATGGNSWTNLTANLPTLGVSAILVHPTTPNTIFIGTGDRDAGDAPGMGVYKTTNGGVTFTASNSGMGNVTVGMLQIHPSNSSILLAATSGGIYKSTDGGTTWTRKSSNTSNYKDIRFKPTDPTIMYATENGKFYQSANTGDSWTQVTSGILSGSRLVIGLSPNQPSWVYLLQTSGPFTGLLKSTNNGLNFTTQSTSPNIMDYACDGSGGSSQAWYDLCIAVDPANANIIYAGGVNIWKSTNGGVSWTISSHWVGSSFGETCAPSVHADIHSLDWSPLNGKLYSGGDGGIYSTSNGGTTWTDISSGLGIAQVYKIGQSASKGSLCINGYQDNGTSSNNNSVFTTVIGGDGMECLIDYSDTNYRYGTIYYGTIFRATSGNSYWSITDNIPESGGWVTPFILHATDPNTMFLGDQSVWRTTNVKATSTGAINWTAISTGLGNCVALEQSPVNVDILYVSRGSSLKRTDNANAASPTWTNCAMPGGMAATSLEAHPTNQNIVYATAGASVYKSTDKGMTWTNISGTLPSMYTNTIVMDKNSNDGLYVGNETGIYYRDASMSDWILFNSGLPIVDVRELEIFYDPSNSSNNRIKAGTYGRGLWQSDLYSVLTVTPGNQNVPASPAGSTTFNITGSGTWTVSSNSTWCTVTPPSGSGNGTITANYTENLSGNQRVAIITITPATGSATTVTVTQAGAAPTLAVLPANQNVPSPAGSTSFTVTSNATWNVVSDTSWCTVTPTGTGNGTISVNYLENFSINQRVAHITITVTGLTPLVVTVTQAGAAPTLAVNPPNQDVSSQAGITTFNVTSNSSWTVVSDATWCIINSGGTGNGTITANYAENITLVQRIAHITTTVSGLTPVSVTVTQSGAAPMLAVNPLNQDVTYLPGMTSFTVTSNTNWTTSSDAPWCTPTPSGTGNGTIEANYTENVSTTPRIATITVTGSGLAPQDVTVSQDGAPIAVEKIHSKGILLYPNPARGSFTIIPNEFKSQSLEVNILDLTGRTILSRNCQGEDSYRFDVVSFPEGCYLVKMKSESTSRIERLIIQR